MMSLLRIPHRAAWRSSSDAPVPESTRRNRLSSARHCVAIGWAVCFCLLLSCRTAHSAEGDDDYNLAVGLFKQSRWSLAADSFDAFLKQHESHPKRSNARMYLGLSLVNQQKYAEAREQLRIFARENPENPALPQALYRIGESSYLLNDLDAAKTELRRFLKLAPDDALGEWAWPYLADAELRTGEVPEGIASFQKSLEQFPTGKLAEDSRFGLARGYQLLGRDADALEQYTEISQQPAGSRAPEALMAIAALHFEADDFARSADVYRQFVERFPKHALVPKAQLNAGFAAFRSGKYQEAIQHFDQAAADAAQAATALYWKANSLKNLDRFAEAAEVLVAAQPLAKAPLDEDVSFQLADVLLQAGRSAEAQRQFLEAVQRWPDGKYAERSLYLAAEAALQHAGSATDAERDGALAKVDELLKRYEAAFPNGGLDRQAELLHGRFWELRDQQGDLDRALATYKDVVETSRIETTRDRARYLLARLQQRQGNHAAAIATVMPLVEWEAAGTQSVEFHAALLLLATSQFAEEQYAPSVESLTKYLQQAAAPGLVAEALALRARGYARLGRPAEAQADLGRLSNEHPASPLVARTTQQLADIAYARQDWNSAQRLFQSLVDLGEETPYFAAGLSGLGWTRYQQRDYAPAAEAFARAALTGTSTDRKLAAEAAYMAGRSLQDAGMLPEAATAYKAAFQEYAPAHHAYLAGLQAARVLATLKKTDAADQAYEQLLAKFPRPEQLDKLLDEWALLNYQARRFERSDVIFQRLIREAPQSDLVDNARFSLAESDLVNGRTDAARDSFQKLAANPRADDAVRENSLFRLMGIAVERQEWEAASQAAQALWEQFPQGKHVRDARFYLAQSQLALDQVEQAQATANELMQHKDDPEVQQAEWFPHLWILLAETHVRQKSYDQAVELIEALKAQQPESPVIYQADEILGRISKNQAQFAKAREAFTRVTESPSGRLTATAAKSQFLIAETYFLEKDYATALREYLKVYHLYKHPEWQAPALFQAGRCDEAMGEWSSALQTYEDLLNTFPDSEFAKQAQARLAEVRQKAGA